MNSFVPKTKIESSKVNENFGLFLREHNDDGTHCDDGWKKYVRVLPTFASSANGVEKLNFGGANTLLQKGTKVKLTSGSGTHSYYVTEVSATHFAVVGRTPVTGIITQMWYSYADCPFGFENASVFYKARMYRHVDKVLHNGAVNQYEINAIHYNPSGVMCDPVASSIVIPMTGYYYVFGGIRVKTDGSFTQVDLSIAGANLSRRNDIVIGITKRFDDVTVADLRYLERGARLHTEGWISGSGNMILDNNTQNSYFGVHFLSI